MSDMCNVEAAVYELSHELQIIKSMGDFNTSQLNYLAKRGAGYEPMESMVLFRVGPNVSEANEFGAIAEGDDAIHDVVINNLLGTVSARHHKKTLYEDGQDDQYIGCHDGREVHILVAE